MRIRFHFRAFLIAMALCAWCVAPLAAGENWPQFRGPNGDGISDASDLPVKFGEAENLRWKTPMPGKAWSSPVVWGKQIWLTNATEDGKEIYFVCVDLDSGKVIYNTKLWDVVDPQAAIPKNSYASPTPAIEAGRVYLHFGSCGTVAIDTATGKTVWERRDLPCNHFRGPASSPIIVDNLLILTFDGFDFNYLAALDKRTGETVWRRDRNIQYDSNNGDYHKAFSTPQVIEVPGQPGKREMVSPSAGATIAYDPASGEELWRVRSGGMNAAARPVFGNGLVYCTAPDGGFQLFAVKPGGRGDVTTSHVAWKFAKGVPSRPSPMLLGDSIFMVANNGVASCIDAVAGTQVWQHRFGGDYSASPVYADGKLYFFDENGAAQVIDAKRQYNELAINHLDDGCMASPAIVGRSLIVRTKSNLYRFEKTP
ncbi:MAG TPA: PQQ-binding-like beta-propeller repeat protein [Pirellulales bacterium]|jgi:outer membrane protein assembly factor BamB